MRYFTTLWSSLTQPTSYRDNVKLSAGFIIGYTLFWYTLLSFCLATYLSIRFFFPITTALDQALTHLLLTYPSDLTLTLTDSTLKLEGPPVTVNLTLPPQPLFDHRSLAILDPTQSTESLANQDTYLAASAQALAINLPGQPTPLIIPYNQLELKGTLTAPQAISLITQTKTNLNEISPLPTILILSISLLVAFLPARIAYTLITALILTLFGSINRLPYRFPHFAKITLTTLVAAETINLLTTMIYGHPTPLVFNLGFLGLNFIALYSLISIPNQNRR